MLKLNLFFFFALTACVGNANNVNDVAKSTEQLPEPLPPAIQQEQANILELHYQQTVRFRNLSLRVTAIEDSRCAIGVTCIWAGQMLVSLSVAKDNGQSAEIKLLHKRVAQAAEVFGYTLQLINIEPQPKKGRVTHISQQIVRIHIVESPNNQHIP